MATTLSMCSRMFSRNICNFKGIINHRIPQFRQGTVFRFNSGATETKSDAVKEEAKVEPESEQQNGNELTELQAKFNEEKEKFTVEMAEMQDKYKRSLAETENVRQRMLKQIEDSKLFGIQGFCKDLLEVADILGKATESVPQELITDENPHLKGLYDGLTMTEGQLIKVFTKHGLNRINPAEGDPFDPNLHEAMFQLPKVEGKQAGSVATVTKIGYQLHSRTIRPAVVGVFKET